MQKYRIATLFLMAILVLAGCKSTDVNLLPESIEQVDVTYSVYSNTTEKWTLGSTEISDWTAWVEALSLKHETFEDDETPSAAYAGGESYSFVINNGDSTLELVSASGK